MPMIEMSPGLHSYAQAFTTACGEPIVAVWYEGEYITLYDRSTGQPYDVINVWDYEASQPHIATTHASFTDAVREVVLDTQDSRSCPTGYALKRYKPNPEFVEAMKNWPKDPNQGA